MLCYCYLPPYTLYVSCYLYMISDIVTSYHITSHHNALHHMTSCRIMYHSTLHNTMWPAITTHQVIVKSHYIEIKTEKKMISFRFVKYNSTQCYFTLQDKLNQLYTALYSAVLYWTNLRYR